jgi:hypothetical protein
MTEERLETRHEASFAEVFSIVTPRLVAFFRARGCKSTVAEGLAQNVIIELTARVREALREADNHDGLEVAFPGRSKPRNLWVPLLTRGTTLRAPNQQHPIRK